MRRRIVIIILLLLAATDVLAWSALWQRERSEGKLLVAFLNVGQGEAIYVRSPTGREIMIDGGPDRAVLAELAQERPFWDRSIDALIVSNPDKDHMAGFIDILERFEVAAVIEPGTVPDTSVYRAFEQATKNEEAKHILARRGMRLDIGGGAIIEILFPDRDVSGTDTNTGSIVSRLVYGSTSFLFMGDAPKSIEEYVVALDGNRLRSNILKIGHHGSRTSTSLALVAAASPEIAVISAGAHNSYGHPHKEVLETLEAQKIPVAGTYSEGTIVIESDGMNLRRISQ